MFFSGHFYSGVVNRIKMYVNCQLIKDIGYSFMKYMKQFISLFTIRKYMKQFISLFTIRKYMKQFISLFTIPYNVGLIRV